MNATACVVAGKAQLNGCTTQLIETMNHLISCNAGVERCTFEEKECTVPRLVARKTLTEV